MRAQWLPVVAAAFFFGCSPSAEEVSTAQSWSLSSAPRLQIGAQEGEAPYLFAGISGVRLLPDGGVVVADGRSSTIRLFSPDGAHLLTLGGSGQGPGEFGWLAHVSVEAPDTILAYDGGLLRITRFHTDGRLIGTTAIQPHDGSPELYLGEYSNGDVALAWIVPGQRDPNVVVPDIMKVGRFRSDGSFAGELGTFQGMRRLGPGPVPFTPFPHALLVSDSLLYTDGSEPILLVVDEAGSQARAIQVSLPAIDVQDAWGSLRALVASNGNAERLNDFPEAAALEPIPVIGEALVDSNNHVWLKHYNPSTDSYLVRGGPLFHGGRWSVVSLDGRVVAEVQMPTGFAPLDISDEAIAGVYRDSLGVEYVWVLDLQK